MIRKWEIRFSNKAEKQYEKLRKSGKRPPINDLIDFLVFDLEKAGPELPNWPNYSKLSENTYHCHLKKGKPTYVACWAVINPKLKQIEIYYVGTHESSPY